MTSALAWPSPLRAERHVLDVEPGATLQDVVDRAELHDAYQAEVVLNGEAVPLEDWETTVVAAGDQVLVGARLAGGMDPQAKGIMTIIGAVLLTAVSFGLAAGATAPLTAAAAAKLLVPGILGVAAGIVSLVAPPPVVPFDGDVPTSAASPAIQGNRNSVATRRPIRRTFGLQRVWPDYAARPFTEVSGGAHYYRYLFFLGEGPLVVTDVRIGETPVADFAAEVVIHPGFDDDATVVWSADPANTGTGGIADLLTDTDTEVGRYVLTFPSPNLGLMYNPSGVLLGLVASGIIDIPGHFSGLITGTPAVGDNFWLDAERYQLTARAADEVGVAVEIAHDPADPWFHVTPPTDAVEGSADLVFPFGFLGYDEETGEPRWLGVGMDIQFRPAGSSDPWVDITVRSPAQVSTTPTGDGVFEVLGKERGYVIRGVEWVYPGRGDWELRVRRYETRDYSTGSDPDTMADRVDLAAVRSIRPASKVRVANACLLELRIAADRLAGPVTNLSCMTQALLPVFNGSIAGWGPDNLRSDNPNLLATRSPAWAYAHVLRGRQNWRPIADDLIDEQRLLLWAALTTDHNFDATVDFSSSLHFTLGQVAASGRASPSVIDGKWSVALDFPQSTPAQHFNPRNSWGFRGSRTFKRRVDAIRASWIDVDSGQPVIRTVPNDGYSADEGADGLALPQDIAELELWGVSDPDTAWRQARYQMAATELRPAVYAFWCDIESLRCTRGDLVRLSHTTLQTGFGGARILRDSLTIEGSELHAFAVDELLEYRPDTAHAAIIRRADGTELGPFGIVSQPDPSHQVTLAEGPTGFPITGIDPAPGDLILWGEAGAESGLYLVYSIQPGANLAALLEVVDYAPAVFDADTEDIPDWTPNITRPYRDLGEVPATPAILSVVSDEAAAFYRVDGGVEPRIRVVVAYQTVPGLEVSHLEVQARLADETGTGPWRQHGAPVAATTRVVYVDPVEELSTYDIRVRTLTADGRGSLWAQENAHQVIGTTTLPPDPINGRVVYPSTLEWDYPMPPRDLAGFLIRYQAGTDSTWETAVPAHDGVETASQFSLLSLPHGQLTIMVRAVDRSSNVSAGQTVVTTVVENPGDQNVVESQDERAGGWAGTKVNCTVDGSGDLVADSDAIGYWGPDTTGHWTSDANLYWTPKWVNMVYGWEWTPLPGSLPGLMQIDITAVGPYFILYRKDSEPLYQRWPGSLPVETSEKHLFLLVIEGGSTQGKVTQLQTILDVPDVTETLTGVVVLAAGVDRLPITAGKFRAITAVPYSIQDTGTFARSLVLMDKAVAGAPDVAGDVGPSVELWDAGGAGVAPARVAGLVDCIVRGY